MTLPRVIVDVVPRDGGWTVHIDQIPPYELDAVTLEDALVLAGDTVAYGRHLYECLFAPAWPAIRDRDDVRAAGGVELALRWPATERHLHDLLWEAMHDGITPLAASPDLVVAVTRLVPVDLVPPEPITGEVRLLLAAGTGLTDDVIRPGAMFMGLLREFEMRGLCTPRVVQDVTLTDLAAECERFRPHIVQLVAHGEHDGGRYLLWLGEGRPGGRAVTPDELFAALGRPTMVVVSACASGLSAPQDAMSLATALVAGGIPAVVAMGGDVSERACRLYTRRLIRAMDTGDPVAVSAAHGRRAALMGAGTAGDHRDWAMPALFLAESLPAGYRVIDRRSAHRIRQVADDLRLRERPVFIGRYDILGLVDDLFDSADDRGLGLVAIVRDGPITGLGGPRLLQEMGLRLLRQGHLPLLLGPYGAQGPVSLREFAVELLDRAVSVAEALDLPPVVPALVGGDIAPDSLAVRRALAAFRALPDPLDAATVRAALRADLGALAAQAAATGPPFGPHTRPVILGNQAHAWVGAIDELLALVTRGGIGTVREPIPVVLTATLLEQRGPLLRTFRDEHVGTPGFRFPELAPMAAAEAALGFQWVLLHPWRTPPDPVYTPARDAVPDQIRQAFGRLEGKPTAVREALYLAAGLLADFHVLESDEEERAFEEYLATQPVAVRRGAR